MLRTIWTEFIALILRRPSRYQVAALCWRKGASGIEILLISSLDTGRWILPKGWPKVGHDGAGTALEEAWEEAGIHISGAPPRPVGRYCYRKKLRGNVPVRTEVDVFAIETSRLLDDYPEAGRRRRDWFAPDVAARLVDEPDLARLLRDSPAVLAA